MLILILLSFIPPTDLKRYEHDWCMFYQESVNCGNINTCLALQLAVCCCECRCGLPTDSAKTVPWLVNIFGFTLWYQFSFPCSCVSTVGELKDMAAADEPWCCPAYCAANEGTGSEGGAVTAQPSAPPVEAPVEVTRSRTD